MSNTIQDIGARLGLDANSLSRAAEGSSSDSFMRMLALQMAEEGKTSGDYNVSANTLAQVAGSSGAELESLLEEIMAQVQQANSKQVSNAAAAAYQTASNNATLVDYPWSAPVSVDGTTQYYDYDVTAYIEPTSFPNGYGGTGGL